MPIKNLRQLLIFSLTLLPFGCGHTQDDQREFSQTVSELEQSGDIEQLMDNLALPLIASGRNIGMVIGVTTPEGDFIKNYGSKTRYGTEPLPKNARFQIGSITKSFAALLAAQYEQEGIIRLEDPVEVFIPKGMLYPGSEFGQLKIGELLSHTSGLPHELYTLDLLWGVSTYLLNGDNLYRFFGSNVLIDWISHEDYKLKNDHQYAYSNVAVSIAGWMLGNLDNKGLRYQLRAKILNPLKLDETDLALTSDQIAALTPGYAGDLPTFIPRHREVTPWLFDEGISASGGLYSTAGDLLKYCKAAIGKPANPLTKAFRRTQKAVTKQPDGEMGYSWFIETLPHAKTSYHHIAGIIGGHTSWVGYDIERGIGVVLMQNSINHDDQISVPLLDSLVAARIKKDALVARKHRPAGISKQANSDGKKTIRR